MDDIKKKKQRQIANDSRVSGGGRDSVIESVWQGEHGLNQDRTSFIRARALPWTAVALLVGVIVIVGAGSYLYGHIGSSVITGESDGNSQQSAMKNKDTLRGNANKALEFDPLAYYGVSTEDGLVYFARITDVNERHYRLESVFYGKVPDPQSISERTNDDGESSGELDEPKSPDAIEGGIATATIELIKLGTENYRPEDVLIVPRENVKQVFVLSDSSPVLRAIRQYYSE